MAWTYDLTKLNENGKDAIRFLVGDTQADAPLVQDEEIAWSLLQYTNLFAAAAQVALSVSAFFATQADMVKIGPIWEQANGRAVAYSKLAAELKREASRRRTLTVTGAIPGSSIFSDGMTDNTGSNYSIGGLIDDGNDIGQS
jgi:hypothetical protein